MTPLRLSLPTGAPQLIAVGLMTVVMTACKEKASVAAPPTPTVPVAQLPACNEPSVQSGSLCRAPVAPPGYAFRTKPVWREGIVYCFADYHSPPVREAVALKTFDECLNGPGAENPAPPTRSPIINGLDALINPTICGALIGGGLSGADLGIPADVLPDVEAACLSNR